MDMEQCIDLTEKRLSLWPSVEHFKMVQDWHQPRNPNKTYHPTTKDSVPIPIRVLDKIGELNCAPLDKLAIATSWAPLDFGLDEDDFFDWADELISEQGRSSSHFLYNLSWLGSRLYPSALKDLSDNQFLGFLGVFKFKEILSGSLRSSPVFSTPSDYFRDVKLLYNFIKSNSENTFQEFIKDSALALPEGIDRYRIMDLDVEFAGYATGRTYGVLRPTIRSNIKRLLYNQHKEELAKAVYTRDEMSKVIIRVAKSNHELKNTLSHMKKDAYIPALKSIRKRLDGACLDSQAYVDTLITLSRSAAYIAEIDEAVFSEHMEALSEPDIPLHKMCIYLLSLERANTWVITDTLKDVPELLFSILNNNEVYKSFLDFLISEDVEKTPLSFQEWKDILALDNFRSVPAFLFISMHCMPDEDGVRRRGMNHGQRASILNILSISPPS